MKPSPTDVRWMRRALTLARRAEGQTSPNPLVGAVLIRRGRILGEGWHHRAGQPHAEIEALQDCQRRGHNPKGATLYVTLEPCSTHGRTPPCTNAILQHGIHRVVVGATDPNPRHAGRGLDLLRDAGIAVATGIEAARCIELNESFNHWIVHRTPWITLKAALTLDGRIATANGESRWITGDAARRTTMRLRRRHDAILVGINTVIHDDPQLTVRLGKQLSCPRRIVLDSRARTPASAQLVTDTHAARTLIVVGPRAPIQRVERLQRQVEVVVAPELDGKLDLAWLCQHLGQRDITSLLVEGGGEVHAAFLSARLPHRVVFFLAPKILGGRTAIRAVAGTGFTGLDRVPRLRNVRSKRVGNDLLLTAEIVHSDPAPPQDPSKVSNRL